MVSQDSWRMPKSAGHMRPTSLAHQKLDISSDQKLQGVANQGLRWRVGIN